MNFPKTEAEWEAWLRRPRCCPEDWGGSHYHCSGCNGVTGMYGHYRGGELVNGEWRKFQGHMCCPNACEKPEAHK